MIVVALFEMLPGSTAANPLIGRIRFLKDQKGSPRGFLTSNYLEATAFYTTREAAEAAALYTGPSQGLRMLSIDSQLNATVIFQKWGEFTPGFEFERAWKMFRSYIDDVDRLLHKALEEA